MKHALHHRTLSNGIPFFLIPRSDVPSATIMVSINVGSRYESPEIAGASHFIEHLMFKGTKRRPTSIDISRELDRFGAEYNAYTSKDTTTYYVKIDAAELPRAIDLLNDMLTHSKFDAEELDRERGVIVEEINMYDDNPASKMEDMLEELVFPENALGRTIAGPREVIRTVPREALMAYHAAHYTTLRTAIALSGNISKEAEAKVEATFGKWKKPKKNEARSIQPFMPRTPKKGEWLAFFSKKTEQVQLGLAFHGLEAKASELPALKLLSHILGGSMSSRLFVEVREKRGLCYNVSAGHIAFEDTGAFVISAGLDTKRVKEAVQVIWKELQQIVTDGVTATELSHAKDHIRGKMMLYFEDTSNQTSWYLRQWQTFGAPREPEVALAELEAVTAAQVKAVAKRLFQPNQLHASLVGPFTRSPIALFAGIR
jgi:predicted Zn-dependent peptidase